MEDLQAEEDKLYRLRKSAFDELIDEKLTADESFRIFRIFQDLLEQALEEVHRQMALKPS